MSLSIVFAEGVASDARGALTLVGVNRSITVARTLPARLARTVFLLAQFVDAGPGLEAHIDVDMTEPNGDTVFHESGVLTLGEKRYPELPGSIEIAIPIDVAAAEYGAYNVQAKLRIGNLEEVTTADLFVVGEEKDAP
jgi:hypothetical protein